MTKPIRLVALLSGSGRTLENLYEQIEKYDLPATIDLVVASRADAYGLVRAEKHGTETAVVASKDFRCTNSDGKSIPDWEAMSEAMNAVILPRKPDLIVFLGYMCLYILPPELEGKGMNIHPGLIPAFCGRGMYGHHVHEAALHTGVKVSGCTVHFVNNEYDSGPIILQRTCPVCHTDSPDDLAARVFEEELKAFPEAIRLFAEGRLRICDNRVEVTPE